MLIGPDETNAGSVNYRIDGDGPRLVLVHPVGLDLTFFDDLSALLSRRNRVLRYDLRGHGNTPPKLEAKNARVADYACDLHALLRQLNFLPTAVAGFSFGGMIAQELALNHPEDITALIISACASTFDDSTRKVLKERGLTAEREGMQAVVDATIQRWFSTEFRQRGADITVRARLLTDETGSWKQAWFAMSDLDTMTRLHLIGVPTLCLAAENDLSAPPHVLRSMAEQIPAAQFAVIPGLPHMLFIEAPDRTATAMTAFLDSGIAKSHK